jgi:uncharacterized protein YajQ (UPF0234 family)
MAGVRDIVCDRPSLVSLREQLHPSLWLDRMVGLSIDTGLKRGITANIMNLEKKERHSGQSTRQVTVRVFQ